MIGYLTQEKNPGVLLMKSIPLWILLKGLSLKL